MQEFRKRLEDLSNGPAVSAWLGLRDPQYVGAVAAQPLDCVTLDMQHGFHDEASALAGIGEIVHAGKPALVRIPTGRWDVCERVLDFGAMGIIAPMINTKADAERFCASVKYPPAGARSFGPRHAFNLLGQTQKDYLENFNAASLSLAMIETMEAYENLDDILAVDGLDGVFFGPADFSISLKGKAEPDAYGKDSMPLLRELVAKTKSAGKIVGGFVYGPEAGNMAAGLGFNLICIGLDLTYIERGIGWHLEGLDFRR